MHGTVCELRLFLESLSIARLSLSASVNRELTREVTAGPVEGPAAGSNVLKATESTPCAKK